MSRIKVFNLPDLGEGLTEGEILKWLVQVGEEIELNQPLVEVETAKAAVEIPAKWAGKVVEIHHPEGTTVEVGAAIVAIDTDPSAGDSPTPSPASLAAVEVAPAEGAVEPGLIGGPAPGGRTAVLVGYGPKTAAAKRRPRKGDGAPVAAAPAPVVASAPAPAPVVPAPAAPVEVPASAPGAGGRGQAALAKPPVRKLAKDLGVDLGTLVGSGPQGSITRDDVLAGRNGGAVAPAAPAVSIPAGQREQRIPVKGVRKLTAENMVASAFTAPHVTVFLTVDMTRTMQAIDRLRAMPEWREVRISPLLLVAKAILLAAKRHPMVNSTWAGDEIIVKDYVNLGIAAATERGLIVPNIKDAGRLTLRELADAMTALVQTAKSGKTPPADMSGGTLTITNVGVFGVDAGTPILPPGESAIVAFGAVRDTPWVHEGEIKIRQVTQLAMSFDHRIIDGELGAKYLRDVGAFLNDPEATLLAWT
ncbi:dihydrolipoamide acetyltransferase component of pyruvate dehydrogenase complex [Asanoa ishikariensis]|uniref:Dihydrolipoamide acetyltransferase component of pyruvate dehydrogenase complex n=2 Tax=Asanoa ishikariensis TaxID=137265 RepID=A0A1H3UWW3_9ACTN|nr:dihydrolipoamide acetyltransferase component of pyruvate dehydrogenase complex [Asanoa ishikariensis]SDZ66776.1 pyruvate dehydrogenase E2 component (dihydrolipoamide acetyltransferase) [Asanoa ishikariensis]